MKRLVDLRFLFTVVAVLELIYAATALLTPPSMVQSVTGWVLTADGQWLAKLMGVALASQAWIAWTFRHQPHLGVARALALYQIGSATVDWVMWLALADQQIFSTTLGRTTVIASILVHYTLGMLLVVGIRAKRSSGDAVQPHL
jgi:hypothetical protein